jgi:hypothetical protein
LYVKLSHAISILLTFLQIPLGQNIGVKYSTQTVSDGTYIAFIALMIVGAVLALLLCNAADVIRSDGTRVVLMKNPSWQSEFIGLWETIRFEPFIILLFPMFWSSNWFYTYQQNNINGVHFSTRTKALNSILYYAAQIIAAAILGCLLDISSVSRTFRAKAAWFTLLVFTVAIWGGGYAYERTYTRADVDNKTLQITDWTDPGYVGPMFLYFFYGFYDALWQATVYWYAPLLYLPTLLHPLTNNLQVHGRTLQLRPTHRQLRRLLQGNAIRWRRSYLVS